MVFKILVSPEIIVGQVRSVKHDLSEKPISARELASAGLGHAERAFYCFSGGVGDTASSGEELMQKLIIADVLAITACRPAASRRRRRSPNHPNIHDALGERPSAIEVEMV